MLYVIWSLCRFFGWPNDWMVNKLINIHSTLIATLDVNPNISLQSVSALIPLLKLFSFFIDVPRLASVDMR